MSKTGTLASLAGIAVLVVFTAGFFHAEKAPPRAAEACVRMSAPSVPPPMAPAADREVFKNHQGLLAVTNSPNYKRAGDLSLRVADCTKAEDELEEKLTAIKGEIVDMVMEGTEGSRTCTLSAVIPADRFRAFITQLRTMGKVQSERITASKLKPGQADQAVAAEGADPRELSLVSIRMADEKVAQTVLESRGVLAASFDRSASHFMKGLAVIVELVGLVLPFALAFLAVAAPALLAMRIRRARSAAL